MRKTPIFVLAGFMAVFEALIVALAPHRIFADEAAMPAKNGMAPGRAERMVLVVDRSHELGAAVCVTAIMPCAMFTADVPADVEKRGAALLTLSR
jgi:hypothetical protein